MNSQEQQDAYRKKCTHFRNGGYVYNNKTKDLEHKPTASKNKLYINAAKRYIRENGLKSFTV